MSGMKAIRVLLAITAVMVVVGGQAALGANGDPVLAGLVTTATAQTSINTTQSAGAGFQVFMTAGSTSTAPAVRGQNNGVGSGVAGIAAGADSYGVTGTNTAATHGIGAAAAFTGGQNDGVRASTANDASSAVAGRNTGNGSGVFGQSNGNGNGVFGKSHSDIASGVYGENTGNGFGVAGRSTVGNGIGVYGEALGSNGHAVAGLSSGAGGALLGTNNGGGPALELHTAGGVTPMTVDSSTKVDNLNADQLDNLDSTELVVGVSGRGGRILGNRIAPAAGGQVLLLVPGLGELIVDQCDGTLARLAFLSNANFDLMYSALYNTGSEEYSVISNSAETLTRARGFVTMNIARDTGFATKIVTIWASWYANGCRFQAQALESPQL